MRLPSPTMIDPLLYRQMAIQQKSQESIPTDLERLRDKFAMAALTGLVGRDTCRRPEGEETVDDVLAKDAYILADAMLKARIRE